MDRSPHDPKRGTSPIKRPSTRPLGDSFVATSKGQQPASGGAGTRPLSPLPAGPLKQAVPQKLEELRRELDGIQRLVTLFTMPILVLRYAMYLEDPSPFRHDEPPEDEPSWVSGEDESFEEEDPIPVGFRALGPAQRVLALEVSEVLKADPKVKQRAQVALHQYEEAARAQQEGSDKLQSLYQMTYEEAWDRIPEIAIERIKGKAYPISGFFDHFKHDPVISRVFPPPRNVPAQGTAPLGTANPASQPPAQPPAAAPTQQPQPPTGDGLLGKLKGLFGKL